MFWKKKTSDKGLIEYDKDNKRENFRLDAHEDSPVYAVFGNQKVLMLNISAGGVAFEFDQGHKGCKREITVFLPGRKGMVLSAQAEIVTITGTNICHCALTGLDEGTIEQIHQYILYAQIHEQRQKRSEKDIRPCEYKKSKHDASGGSLS